MLRASCARCEKRLRPSCLFLSYNCTSDRLVRSLSRTDMPIISRALSLDPAQPMALEVGSRLGHYDVSALIGEGGMGRVYRATDTKLNRQVALKILPDAFASNPDRLKRFHREAHVLASLNTPRDCSDLRSRRVGRRHGTHPRASRRPDAR